jgi:hypothetical protein
MRTIPTGVAVAVLGGACAALGCASSTGDGTVQRRPDPAGTQQPATNPDSPAANPAAPAGDPNQPAGNSAAPAVNPDQPAQNPNGTTGKSCRDLCDGLEGCAQACTDFCGGLDQILTACSSQTAAFRTCVERAGLACNRNKLAVVSNGCQAESNALVSCSRAGQTAAPPGTSTRVVRVVPDAGM